MATLAARASAIIATLDFITCPFTGNKLEPAPRTPYYLIANSDVATLRVARKEIAVHVPQPPEYLPRNHRRSRLPYTVQPPPRVHLANREFDRDKCATMLRLEGPWKTRLPFRSRPWRPACPR